MANSNRESYCRYCHRVTLLRCKRCDKPICLKCGVKTPTGRECRDCVQCQHKIFERGLYARGRLTDYPIAFGVSLGLASVVTASIVFTIYVACVAKTEFEIGIGVISPVAAAVGFWWANLIRKIVHRRRSRYLKHATAAGMIVGAISGAVFMCWMLELDLILITSIAAALCLPFSRAAYQETI